MTEEEAKLWVREHFGVSRETELTKFEVLLREEAVRQNLIAASTLDSLWARHFVDSAQLVPLAGPSTEGCWVDIGSGAGLPGLVVAILTDRLVELVEPRSRRVEFLQASAAALGIENRVTVHAKKIESYRPSGPVAVISARAVAELGNLLHSAWHCADSSTTWLLPKGRNVQTEVEAARAKWQGVFHVEPSITSPDSGIVVAQGIRPR